MKGAIEKNIAANALNNAGGVAYKTSARHALAQYVSTSCLNGTFYTTADEQVDMILALAQQVNDPVYVAQVAVYMRRLGKMKESPAVLCAWLANEHSEVLTKIFDQVINNGDMLRKFVRYIRSGKMGRRSLGGTAVRRLVQKWFQDRDGTAIFHQSIGNDPSLGDILKIAHPKPDTAEKAALYAYLLNGKIENGQIATEYLDRATGTRKTRTQSFNDLPTIVKNFEVWKRNRNGALPKINFQFLTSQPLSRSQWKEVARNMNWNTTKKNLNTLARQGVFEDSAMVELIAQRLRDAEQVAAARILPFEILAACLATESGSLPREVKSALDDSLELATGNTPLFNGKVEVFVDVSGSMVHGRVTGNRSDNALHRNATPSSSIRCIDAAALFAAAVLRRNPTAGVTCFAEHVKPKLTVDPEDTVFNITKHIVSNASGGTDCSAPIAMLNARNANADLLVCLSDYESWFDRDPNVYRHYYSDPTKMMKEWLIFKKRNPNAKLVCLDITPSGTAQVKEREDILQIGGFSDKVWGVIERFLSYGWSNDHWIKEIESVIL